MNRKWQPNTVKMNSDQFKEEKKFALTVGGVFLILAVYLFFKNPSYSLAVGSTGTILLLLAIIIPSKLTPLKNGWFKLGHYLGYINTLVLLSLLYWIIITPIGLLLNLSGKDLLGLKFNHKSKTYWKDRTTGENIQMNRQF